MTADEETLARFEEHRALTDQVLKEALRIDKAGDEQGASDLVWALRDYVLNKARS